MIAWLMQYILSRVSVDRLIAYALNWLITNYLQTGKAKEYYSQAKEILTKVDDSIAVAKAMLEDDKVEETEVARARKDLLAIWARGGENVTLRHMVGVQLSSPKIWSQS